MDYFSFKIMVCYYKFMNKYCNLKYFLHGNMINILVKKEGMIVK